MQEPNPLLRCMEGEQPTQGLARLCLLGSFLQGSPSNLAVGLQQQPSAHQPHACPPPPNRTARPPPTARPSQESLPQARS